MSLTYEQISRNALLKIGVMDETQAVSAVQVSDGIRLLNELLIEGEEAGSVNLGFVPGTVASDTVKIPRWAERAVTFDLGLEFATDYHVQLTPEFMTSRDEAHQRLMARSIGEDEADLSYLPRGQTKRRPGGERPAF